MEYLARKLCSINGAITPAGTIIEIDDKSVVKTLLALDAIELASGSFDPGAFGEIAGGAPTELDADAFAAWVAAGAKVGEVIDWIGDDVSRAEIGLADARKSVQKHIDTLLASEPELVDVDVDADASGDE